MQIMSKHFAIPTQPQNTSIFKINRSTEPLQTQPQSSVNEHLFSAEHLSSQMLTWNNNNFQAGTSFNVICRGEMLTAHKSTFPSVWKMYCFVPPNHKLIFPLPFLSLEAMETEVQLFASSLRT